MQTPFSYHLPSTGAAEKLAALRTAYAELHKLLTETCPPSRELSVAVTNLEQSAMWANKAVTHNDPHSKPL